MKWHWAVPVLVSILILGSLGLSQQAFAQIPPGFVDFSGHCYGETAVGTWAATELEAVSFGGHLVTMNDAAEDAFVFSIATLGAFIGYNDIAVEGVFEWVSGEVTGYENWSFGEPSGDSDFVHLLGTGLWNDAPPFETHTGIIELDDTCAVAFAVVGGTSIPIDSTALLLAGVQSISMWMILGVLSAVGIGLAIFSLKRR